MRLTGLKGLFAAIKESVLEQIAEPIARKLGKSTAEIITTKGEIEIEGKFTAASINIAGTTTPYDIGDAFSEQVEPEIVLTFVTRNDGKVEFDFKIWGYGDMGCTGWDSPCPSGIKGYAHGVSNDDNTDVRIRVEYKDCKNTLLDTAVMHLWKK